MLAFSELEPPGYGPRRVTQAEIRDAFAGGWRIDRIRPATFESRTREGPWAWLSAIVRLRRVRLGVRERRACCLRAAVIRLDRRGE